MAAVEREGDEVPGQSTLSLTQRGFVVWGGQGRLEAVEMSPWPCYGPLALHQMNVSDLTQPHAGGGGRGEGQASNLRRISVS